MSYLGAIGSQVAPIGAPPAQPKNIGTPPTAAQAAMAQQKAEPPAYDVALDPGWAHIVGGDHQLQAVLNNMSPEERQVIQQRIQALLGAMKGGAVSPGVPPNAQVPLSTSRAPGTI